MENKYVGTYFKYALTITSEDFLMVTTILL